MIVGKAIYYLLTNDANIAALVDDRVYPEVANQQDAKPYVVYNVRSNDPSDTQKGPSELDTAAVEINCYAPTYETAIAISVAVRAAIDRVQGTYNGVNVQSCQYQSEVMGFDEPQRLYRVMADYQVRILRSDVTLPQVMIDAGVYNLDDLSDVNAPNPTDGQALIYDDATSTWIPGDVSATLAALTDVDLDEPLDREALVYDEVTTSWINGGPAKVDVPVFNNTFNTITKGQVIQFGNSAQGDRMGITLFSATSINDPKGLLGIASENIPAGQPGHVRSYGTIYGINTNAYPVGTILYASVTDGQLTSTVPTAPNHRIAIAVVTRQHVNTGRIFVRTYTPAFRLADLSNVASTSPTTGQALSWDGSKWAPANVGYIPGSPPPGGFLGNVFYQDNAGNFTQEDAFRYTASTNTLAVENITGTTVTGTGVVKGSNTFGQRYATQAATNRAAANTASLTVERYFTVTAEGNGESFNVQSNTPSSGNKIVRKIWYKNEAFEATDVDTWTLLHTFADDTAYASTATKWQEYLDGQTYGTPPFTLALSWEDVPAFTGLLDTYGGAAAAYSLRLLDSTYTGDAIRVRRASDNTEQDIGFDGNGDLDISALATFCAGTNGFVKTWYDQSGNTLDATQTTTANQPKIYDSSTGVVTENGKPKISFDGSNDNLLCNAAFTEVSYISAVYENNDTNTFRTILGADATTTLSGSYYFQSSANVIRRGRFQRTSATNTANYTKDMLSAVTTGTQIVQTGYITGSTLGIAQNGFAETTSINTADLLTIGGTDSGRARIGAGYFYKALVDYANIGLQELIVYSTDQSTNRAGIEANINDYYSIY